jgi:C1A family cysteine protease
MTKLNVTELNKTLHSVQARWQAEEQEERKLGYVPGPEEHSLQTREMLAHSNHLQFMAMAAAGGPPYSPAIDWRAFPATPPLPAGDYVTPVEDQKSCGSCVAFGTVAGIESAVRIHAKNPHLAVDLSEADLFYCHGGINPGPTCETGWNPDAALNVCQKVGIVDAACFPYTPGDQPCKKCADWQKRLTKITAWSKITTTAGMKQWLASHGPLITCMSVYADFQSYRSGVYHHVTGPLEGGHCICCVGYNDASRYWICKNSWNTSWGEQGFFRIAYGQCGIDATMWAVQL